MLFRSTAMTHRGQWRYHTGLYDRLLTLPYSGWAWEFKRRDPALLKAYRSLTAFAPAVLERSDGSTLIRQPIRCPVAEQFGLHFLPDPRKFAYETTPFWLPDIMSANMDAAAAIAEKLREGDRPLNWRNIPGRKTFLMVPGRRTKLNIASDTYTAQLAIDPSEAPVPLAIYLTLQIGARHLIRENLRLLQDFADHCCGLKFDCRPRRGYAPDKLKQALIALDGSLAGASQREIGAAIFGDDQIKSDWDTGVHAFKSRTRRLIRKGRDLMEKDYRDLL